MHTVMRSFALIAAMAMIGLSPAGALADMVKDSGSIDSAYVKRDAQPISENHVLVLSEVPTERAPIQADSWTASQLAFGISSTSAKATALNKAMLFTPRGRSGRSSGSTAW